MPMPAPTLSPGSKIETVTDSPSAAPSIRRGTASWRWRPTLIRPGGEPHFESLRSATASNASWHGVYPSAVANFTARPGHARLDHRDRGQSPGLRIEDLSHSQVRPRMPLAHKKSPRKLGMTRGAPGYRSGPYTRNVHPREMPQHFSQGLISRSDARRQVEAHQLVDRLRSGAEDSIRRLCVENLEVLRVSPCP